MSAGLRKLVLALSVAAVAAAVYFFVLPRFFISRIDPDALIAARENARILQKALTTFAADADDGRFPVGTYDYEGIQRFLPGMLFPADPRDGGWAAGSFLYESMDGGTYTIKVRVDSPSRRRITITPLGIGMTDTALRGAIKRGERWKYIEPRD